MTNRLRRARRLAKGRRQRGRRGRRGKINGFVVIMDRAGDLVYPANGVLISNKENKRFDLFHSRETGLYVMGYKIQAKYANRAVGLANKLRMRLLAENKWPEI